MPKKSKMLPTKTTQREIFVNFLNQIGKNWKLKNLRKVIKGGPNFLLWKRLRGSKGKSKQEALTR